LRVLGVDFGSVRIGIAVGDTDAAIATPKLPLTPSGTLARDAQAIAQTAKAAEAEAIVVGVPSNEADLRMARICGLLAGHLRDLGWTVHLVDESLTSVEAERTLASAGLKAKAVKDRKDGEAAALILERFFHDLA
jgi:putative pre-16S rRNA nuclease